MADSKMTSIPGLRDDATFAEKRQFIEALSFYPAVLIMIFIRRKIGFRLIKSNWMFTVALVLIALANIFPDQARPFPFVMVLFAIALAGLGAWQRYRRWCEICNGVRWHTYSPGVSYLEIYFPWPAFLQSHRRINRYLDPILCLILGLIAALFCHMLGELICVCALALAITENALFERMLARDLDTLDGLIAAEVQGETVKFYEGPQPAQKQRTLEQTAGIPTGVAPDIQKQVELRKAKRAAAPDNMVKDVIDAPA